ncbi:uncharacterized protein LOC143191767 isoform X1 [Rhynchophorus ferrugineus]|uniref:uncharacterized protein LOC143191767 isoform X1 n=1 Tax=Rhynchophorus ferrugineus TaxID=354439 RepID=UPI003FCE8980
MYRLIVFLAVLCRAHSVPPTNDESVISEISTIKNTIKVLSDQWEKWNTLFITSLEPRVTSTASTLSSIDSNIHNLQERAHVWDTFQLHVAAWNDQLASLDRKMDILSKGSEKLMTIDGKVNTMLSAEYKIDRLTKIVTTLEESIVDLSSSLKNKYKPNKATLFEEFAVRGILSSLKLVERKLDRLLVGKQNDLMRIKNLEENAVKCSLPKVTEDLLNDISSKVDIIFDAVHKKIENDYSDDYLDVKYPEGSGDLEIPSNLEQNPNAKKVLTSKRNVLVPILTDITGKLADIERTLFNLQRHTSNINYDVQNACNKTTFEQMLRNLLDNYWTQQGQHINIILDSYFKEHRTYLESLMAKFDRTNYAVPRTTLPIPESTTDIIRQVWTTTTETPPPPTTTIITTRLSSNPVQIFYITDPNKMSCDNLEPNELSGIYVFKYPINVVTLIYERFFKKKVCVIRDDGPWTVVQRRDNYTNQQDFNVSWNDYKFGFGDLEKDFWMGNNFLARWSRNRDLVLRIELEDFEGNTAWAEYDHFRVGEANEEFKLSVGGYSGNASDSLGSHNGAAFSTYDRKNDKAPECCPCSVSYGGGWWFTRCFESNLNGIYFKTPRENEHFRGLIWEHWLGNYSLKKSVMMVKSKFIRAEEP